jgi:hypothetical protein
VLAIEYYPRKVVANLRALESLGAREPLEIRGEPRRFGFRDALNVRTGRTTPNVLGLDQSMLFLSLANYITGDKLQRAFQSDALVQRGRSLAGDYAKAQSLGEEAILARRDLEPVGEQVIGLDLGVPVTSYRSFTGLSRRDIGVGRAAGRIEIDGQPDEWADVPGLHVSPRGDLESGAAGGPGDFDATVRCLWDDESLYLCVQVTDDDIVNGFANADLWRGDCVELFVDPKGDGFVWGDRRDYQIGLAPSENAIRMWSWFDREDPSGSIRAAMSRSPAGYVIEAAIPWTYLGLEPAAGMEFGLSPAVHDLDSLGPECKVNWSYQLDGKHLGRAVLEQ